MKLARFNNDWYSVGRPKSTQIVWFYINALIFKSSLFPLYSIKVWLLRKFGATVGSGVFIKPNVNIKYPWNLGIGNDVWIGEEVWIDNLAKVQLGDNVCISQGAMLLTGNHNYKKDDFDLIIGEIIVKEGVWIGARTTVCSGVTCAENSILSVGSVATSNLESNSIYQGVPAIKKKERNRETE